MIINKIGVKNKKLNDIIESIFDSSTTNQGSAANQFLFGSVGADGKRINDGAFDIISKNFAGATTGNVIAIVPNANIGQVFGATELSALMENPNVQRINGIDKSDLLALAKNPPHLDTVDLDNIFSKIKYTSELQMAATGLNKSTSGKFNGLNDLLNEAGVDLPEYLKNHPEAQQRLADYLHDLRHSNPEHFKVIRQHSKENIEFSHNINKIAKKLGLIGSIVSLIISADEAIEILHSEGIDAAKQHMIDWGISATGGFVGGTLSHGIGTIVLGLAGAAGVTVSAPLAGAILFGAAIIGGMYGEDIAKQIHELWEDMDKNGHRDFIDRFNTAVFGQKLEFDKIPEIFKNSATQLRAEMPLVDLIAKAKEDIAYRYALRELNPFVAEGADYADFNGDGSLNLWDINHPGENTNGMTEEYIRDRSQMVILQMRYLKNNLNLTYDLVDDIVQGDWDYYDLGIHPFAGNRDRPIELSIDGNGIMTDNHRIVFGTDNNPKGEEILEGGGRADRLYGRGGNDVLKGGAGDDYYEGGKDFDAYHIQEHDTILDTDGQGKLLFADGNNTIQAQSFMAIAPDTQVWKSVNAADNTFDNQFRAWRESNDLHIVRLNADGTDSADQATIRHYFIQEKTLGKGKVLGIDLRDYQDPGSIAGNAQTLEIHAHERYHNIFNLQDDSYILYGGSRHDTVFAQGAQSGASGHALRANLAAGDDIAFGSRYADIIFGGEGTDILNGSNYMRGADGRSDKEKALDADYLAGGAGTDFIHGFAGNDIIHTGDPGEHEITEAGNSQGDWATGGEGDDTIYGSQGKDLLQGSEGSDIIYGGADHDLILGDAFICPDVALIRTAILGGGFNVLEQNRNAKHRPCPFAVHIPLTTHFFPVTQN